MFSTFRSASLEKTVILGAHHAKLQLLSEQAEQKFKQLKKDKKDSISTTREKGEKKEKAFADKRNQRNNLQTSKLNLWPLFKDGDKAVSDHVYKSLIRLIENLYEKADFFQGTSLAKNIVDAMVAAKKEKLSECFPEDEALEKIYYKMLKGTNTGYPALEEYVRCEKTDYSQPIVWQYASAPVLRAVLGDEATKLILAAERASWEENHRKGTLPKEKLKAFLSHSLLESNKIDSLFCFQATKKGLPQAHVEKQTKVMASAL